MKEEARKVTGQTNDRERRRKKRGEEEVGEETRSRILTILS